ncbi:MAG: polysulfide reductase NrfD, partial [Chloroflexota bacterium]|nr:polysulfide reductase NrfD [Chloroflexota bacterium]
AQAPGWEWYFVAMYFFVGGTSAGAYFVGSLIELFGGGRHRDISKIAFYIAFPLILIAPILLIVDLGQPARFWHLFFTPGLFNAIGQSGVTLYANWDSPLSIGSWALLVYGAFSFLSFVDNLVADGVVKFAPFANLYNRVPRKLYALVGSLAGFFVAGYTGVLLNVTALPLWAATDPLLGALFLVSGGSSGAAAIALVMAWRRIATGEGFDQLESFDRISLVAELVLIVVAIVIAGQFAAPLMSGSFALLFWGGTVVLGILAPLALDWYGGRGGSPRVNLAVLTALLVLLGGALLRISLVAAGQA